MQTREAASPNSKRTKWSVAVAVMKIDRNKLSLWIGIISAVTHLVPIRSVAEIMPVINRQTSPVTHNSAYMRRRALPWNIFKLARHWHWNIRSITLTEEYAAHLFKTLHNLCDLKLRTLLYSDDYERERTTNNYNIIHAVWKLAGERA